MQIRKQPFLLLEVLIAIVLVTLSLFPLLTPYLWMIRSEQNYRSKVEMDHLSNHVYASIIEQLYRAEISWEVIESEKDIAFTLEGTPYHASYRFTHKKKKCNEGQGVFLKTLKINIWPRHLTLEDAEKKKCAYSFSPKICLVRTLAKENQGEADET
ncbi:MAG: hypothetical protein WD595_04880 [Waddliaceae bacterium]